MSSGDKSIKLIYNETKSIASAARVCSKQRSIKSMTWGIKSCSLCRETLPLLGMRVLGVLLRNRGILRKTQVCREMSWTWGRLTALGQRSCCLSVLVPHPCLRLPSTSHLLGSSFSNAILTLRKEDYIPTLKLQCCRISASVL